MLKKTSLAAGFLLAAQPVFSQAPASATTQPASPDLSKFISLPDGPKGQWVIHGGNEITVRCLKGEKTADGKLGNPFLSIDVGRFSATDPSIQLDVPAEMLNIPKSGAIPAMISFVFDAAKYCNPNGTVKGDGQAFVDDIIMQTARQFKIPKPELVNLLATLAR